MKSDRCLIIAEAGVNHNGRLDLAFKLCDAAKNAGADVVKFQTWKTEKVVTQNVGQAEYQAVNTGVEGTQFDMLKQLELPYSDFRKIKEHCDEIGIVFASTADEEESLDFLVGLGIPFIKVGSGDIGNIRFLRLIGAKKLPVILSTGMSSLADVDISIHALREGGAEDITLLHCTTDYPCRFADVNLKAMATLRDAFRLPVGYSDHTIGSEVPVAAVALGAKVVEKHFTLDKGMEGPDHAASMEPGDFKEMATKIRHIEAAFGSGRKSPARSEAAISAVVRKRIVAAHRIMAGQTISEADIQAKRSHMGVPALYWDFVVGKKAGRDYLGDEGIEL